MKNTVYSVQILRGIAAFMVALYHYATWNQPMFADYPIFQEFASKGSSGVNVFFLISGFIMYSVTNDRSDPLKFIGKRLVRVVPLYYIVALTFAGFRSFQGMDTVKSLLFIPLSANNAPFFGYAVYAPGWTLNYEMLFYLLFTVSLFFKSYRYIILFGIFMLFYCFSLAYTDVSFWNSFEPNVSTGVHYAYWAMMLNPMLLLFGIGIFIGYLYAKLKKAKKPYHLMAFTLSVIAMFLFCLSGSYWGGHGVRVSIFCTLLLILFLSLERFIVHGKTIYKLLLPFIGFGSISYSVYLLHLMVLNQPFFKTVPEHEVFRFLLVFACIIAVSCVSYYYVEKRLTKYLHRKLHL